MNSQQASIIAMQLINARRIESAAEFIRNLQHDGITLGRHSNQIANALISSFPWDLVSQLLPNGCNFFEESGWIKSLTLNAPVDKQGNPIPWLNYSCLDFIFPRLKQKPNIFEWGSGYSTLWWSSLGGKVVSIEDKDSWYEKVAKDSAEIKNLEIRFCEDLESYVSAITDTWDVIQIDGSYRNECAKIAAKHLNPGGFILFDNSDSPDYSASISHLHQEGFYRIDFFGLIPTLPFKNCTSIFFKDLDLITCSEPPNRQIGSPVGISCFQSILGIR
jgi:hypothetical protein